MDSNTVRRIFSKLVSLLALSGTLSSFVGLPCPVVRAQGEQSGQIAYIGEDGNLWLMNSDGSNQTQLTHLTEDKVWMYAWSPDGSRIACLGKVSHKLYLVALPEMSLHHVVGIERIYQLVWSPSGERLAVVTSGDIRATVGSSSWADDNRILLVDPADWEVQEIADGYAPQWAPDGRELFYVSNYRETEDPPQEIRSISTTGDVRAVTGLRELGTTLPIESLTLSPDGSRIAVWGASLELIGTLWTLRADGSELRRIVEWVQPNQFNWSPDGVWLVYREEGEAFATDTGPTGLSLTNVATGETQMFLHDRRQGNEVRIASYPTWTSDGTSIILCESRAGLVMMDPGTQARDFEEGDTLTGGCPVTYPELGLGLAASWSPDGQHLAVEQAGQICVVAIGCLADGHLPAWRPAVPGPSKERIAYIGPDGNVWLISSDGTNPTRITDDAVENVAGSNVIRYCCLSWSPDGRLLTFGRGESTYASSLRIYDIANESSHDLQDISPLIAWKADSSGFAFTMPCDGWQMDIESGDMTMPCDEKLRGIWQMDLESGHRSELVPSEQGYILGHPIWSPDGHYLSFEESGLILGEPGTIEGHGLFALFEIDTQSYMPWGESIGNYSWAPSGDYLVYDQVVYLPQAGSRLWRADVRGNNRVPLTPVSTSTSDHFPRFSPTGDRIAFFRGEPAPCCTPLWVMNADGTDVYQATPFEVRYAAWSPDGQKLAVETGVYQEEEIFILNLMTGETRKITEGSYPVWQPHVPGPSVSDLLARKQAAIPRLEQTSVEILGLHFPIESYDETEAGTLVQCIQEQAESDSLSPDQVEAFTRLTVQEEGLAGLLPLYSQTSADLTEVGTDVVGILLSLGREADRALEACYTSGNPFSGACQTLHRLIHRQILRILNSLVRVTTWLIPETQQREEIRDLWMLITDSVMLRLDARDTVRDILLGTVVKGPAVGFLVHRYVDTVQPSLDQGVRSADPTYAGSESTWPVEGQLEPAELHMEGIVEQAIIRAEHAHSVHEDLMRGADLAQLLTDIADLGQLSPLTALARIAAIAARVEHLLVDVSAMAVNFNSMRCTRYLSTRAGSLAFNPNQPSENCEYIGDSSFSAPRMAREHAGGGNATAWEPVWSHVASDVDTYEEAVTSLLAAMRDGDAEAITEALTILDEADRVLGSSTDQATSVILSSNAPDSEAMEVLSRSNQFSLDALELYLLVASYVTAPEAERLMTKVEQAARDVLYSLGEYGESLQAAALTGTEGIPLPVIQTIVLPDEVVVEEPFDMTIAVRNVGSADVSAVAVRVQATEQGVQAVEVGPLDTNQTYTTTLQAQGTHTGTLTLLIEVTMGDSVTDSRMDQVRVELESPEKEEASWPQPGCCRGLSGLIALPVIIAIKRVHRRPHLWSGGKLPLDHG